MDKLSVKKKGPKQPNHEKLKKGRPPLRVVYISHPKKIVTTPSEFKGCVQLYTGKDSNVARAFEFDDIPAGAATSPQAPLATPSTSTASDSTRATDHVDVASASALDDADDIFAGLYGLEEAVALYV